jgi:hypothetical protein
MKCTCPTWLFDGSFAVPVCLTEHGLIVDIDIDARSLTGDVLGSDPPGSISMRLGRLIFLLLLFFSSGFIAKCMYLIAEPAQYCSPNIACFETRNPRDPS